MKLKDYLPYLLIIGLVIFLVYDKCVTNPTDHTAIKVGEPEIDPLKAKAIEYTKLAGSQLIDCCSSSATGRKRMYQSHKVLRNGRLSINMYVQWTGGSTGCVYTIYGELTVDENGCQPQFRKRDDKTSKLWCAFVPGCASGCMLSECLS